MTSNQKIITVGFLSALALVLVSVGGMAIKDIVGQDGGIPVQDQDNGKESPIEENDANYTLDDTDNKSDDEGVINSELQDNSEQSEEENSSGDEAGAAVKWQTYRNDFYSIDYPGNYEVGILNQTEGTIDFKTTGFGDESIIYISRDKKILGFDGTWGILSEDDAASQKLLDVENIDMNGIRFKKEYWAIRQISGGDWLAAIVYYGCNQNNDCFSLLRGVTAKGIPVWDEQTADQLMDKIKIKTLVNIIKTSNQIDTVNFNKMFLTFRFAEKISPEITAQSGQTKWREYLFEPLLGTAADSSDRRLVGIQDDGTKDIIAGSVKSTMGWNSLPGFYPNKVLFPPYSKEIYFTKYLSDSGASSGVYALDVTTLKYRRLVNVGNIYENYNNYSSIISPNKRLIASLGSSSLYVLDPAADTATAIASAAEGEILNPAEELKDFKWVDDNTIQYPVYKSGDLNKVFQVRKATIN